MSEEKFVDSISVPFHTYNDGFALYAMAVLADHGLTEAKISRKLQEENKRLVQVLEVERKRLESAEDTNRNLRSELVSIRSPERKPLSITSEQIKDRFTNHAMLPLTKKRTRGPNKK